MKTNIMLTLKKVNVTENLLMINENIEWIYNNEIYL